MMRTSEQINEIAKAMSLAQSEMKPAAKDSVNPHFKSRYSDISSIWEAIRGPMTANGLTIWQNVTTEEGFVCITTRIVHSSGQWVEFGPLNVPLSKKDAHGVGSAISYGKRYALCAAVGVVSGDEDDDGNASKATPPPQFKMTPEMIRELNLIIDECGEDYSKKVMDVLHGFAPPIRSFGELTIELYERIKSAAIKERDKRRSGNGNETPS
jgi:hypothetical protein